MDRVAEVDIRPTPDDFDGYVPWACHQLSIPGTIVINKVAQNEYIAYQQTDKKNKSKHKPTQWHEGGSELAKKDTSVQPTAETLPYDKPLHIKTTYDNNDNLVQIKFDKCRCIPCEIFKLLALIMQFHPHCTNLTINKGINNVCLYEIIKVITSSNVTDLCLDDTFIKNAHYHILLEQPNNLRYLSLCRCKITDEEVEKIAKTISFPEPSSHSLMILNLASNTITDVGAKCIAEALRTNRQLCYLNLSDNRLTDDGVIPILNCLGEFLLTTDELIESRTRMTNFMRYKRHIFSEFLTELRQSDVISLKPKGRKSKVAPLTTTKAKNDISKSRPPIEDRSNSYEALLNEKALAMADAIVGEFNDPFSDTIPRDYQIYSPGNNKLSYLNLAYNNITVLSLKVLLKVVVYQKGKGLININLEGNNLPKTCIELVKINDVLDSSIMMSIMNTTAAKKKSQHGPKTGK